MKHFIGTSRNSVVVYIDLISSTAVKDISRQPHLLSLVAEALPNMYIDGSNPVIEYDIGRPVGYDVVIEANDNDSIFYVRLLREENYTRFTKKGSPIATSFITLTLTQSDDTVSYNVHSIWIGHARPAQPGSSEEIPDSLSFWKEHAVIFQNQAIQTQTLTKNCPY